MSVVVTGGLGFVGQNLYRLMPEWDYPNRSELDLFDYEQTIEYLSSVRPTAVIHLAGFIGGIKINTSNPCTFYESNVRMNTNLLHACVKLKIPRVLSSLSTCAFPDHLRKYPFNEYNIMDGAPAESNLEYAFAKRGLYIHTNAIRKQYGLNYSTFTPSNVFGPHDNFTDDNSHFMPALIRKIHESDGEVTLWGKGTPRRQQLYVKDLCRAITMLLYQHNTDLPIIVAPYMNRSIAHLAELTADVMGKKVEFKFTGELDGQYRKDGSNEAFLNLIPAFKFTPIEKAIEETYKWYKTQL